MGKIKVPVPGARGETGTIEWEQDLVCKWQPTERVLQYWRSIKPSNKPNPSPWAFDLLELAPHLNNIFLVDCDREDGSFRIRFVGPALAVAHGGDGTGLVIDPKTESKLGQLTVQLYNAVIDIGYPCITRARALVTPRKGAREFVDNETIFLPLAEDHVKITRIAGCQTFAFEDRPLVTSN